MNTEPETRLPDGVNVESDCLGREVFVKSVLISELYGGHPSSQLQSSS